MPATRSPRFSVTRLLGRAWLRLFGWTYDDRIPGIEKAVLIAYPHTSNWDLPFSLATAWAIGIRMQWVAKHTLFKPPFGGLMRALGGVPVDRRAHHNTVEALADLFNHHQRLILLIAPTGTRSKAPRWKSGFYWAAVQGKVPIVLGFLDYAHKRSGIGEVFWPTGDLRKDFETIRAFYSGMKGKFPENQGEISLGPEEADAPGSAASGPPSE